MSGHERWLPRRNNFSNNPLTDISPTLPNQVRQRAEYLLSVAEPHITKERFLLRTISDPYPYSIYTAFRTPGADDTDTITIFGAFPVVHVSRRQSGQIRKRLLPKRLPVAVIARTPAKEDKPDSYDLLSCALHTRTPDGQFSFQYDFGLEGDQQPRVVALNSPTQSYREEELHRIPPGVKERINNAFAKDLGGTTIFVRS